MFSIKKNTLLFVIVILPIFVDQLNGFFIDKGIDVSVSQLVKGIYLIIFLFFITKKHQYLLLYLVWFIILGIGLLNASIVESDPKPYSDLIFITKLLTLPLSYHCFCLLRTRLSAFHSKYCNLIFLTLFFTIFFALILSVLGFGLPMYGYTSSEAGKQISLGYRGYFIAGNELSALFLLLYSFSFYYAYCVKRHLLIVLAVAITGFSIGILVATKTAILSFLLVTLLVPVMQRQYLAKRFYLITKNEMLFVKAFCLIFFLACTVSYVFLYDAIQANIDYIKFNYDKAGDLITLLTSGRNERIGDSISVFKNDYNLIQQVFGTGWDHPQNVLTQIYLGDGSAEVDWVDLLVSVGLLGVIMIYGFWIHLLKRAFTLYRARVTSYSIPVLLATALLFINSFISGHIIYSSLLGLYLGYYSAMCLEPKLAEVN